MSGRGCVGVSMCVSMQQPNWRSRPWRGGGLKYYYCQPSVPPAAAAIDVVSLSISTCPLQRYSSPLQRHFFVSGYPMYYIVVFICDNSVEYVPKEWMVGLSSSYWPKKSRHLSTLRKARTTPNPGDSTYKLYDVRILGSASK